MTRTFLRNGYIDVRRRLRAADVLTVCGREPNDRDRYFCPFHPDDATGNPSADVYESDAGDRFGCWSCGESMDALELLMRLTSYPIERAVEFADSIIAGSTLPPPSSKPLVEVSADRLEDELRRHTVDIRYPNDLDPLMLFADVRTAKGEHTAPLDYLRDVWGWAGDYNGRIAMPHRTYAGRVSGVRYRTAPWTGPDSKGGRPHSRFRQLYGGHRLGDQHEVWVTEGESDTSWTAYNLEPLGVGVVGMPGSAMPIRPDEVDLLRGRDVVLALDADTAGNLATQRWRTALADVANVSVLRVSPGEDLSSMSESLVDLWSARAR